MPAKAPMSKSGRRSAAESNFTRAKNRLRKILNRGPRWGLDQFLLDDPSANCDATVESMAAAVETVVERSIELRNAPKQYNTREKVQEIMRTWIRASYPYIQIFLGASKTGSSISGNPYGIICDGLLGLVKIAYYESKRVEEINEVLETLVNIVHRIQLTADFPPELPTSQLDNIHCAALDLCTAIMDYLSISLKYNQRSFFANLLCCLSHGTVQFDEAKALLDVRTRAYTAAVGDLGCFLGMRLVGQATEIQTTVNELASQTRLAHVEFSYGLSTLLQSVTEKDMNSMNSSDTECSGIAGVNVCNIIEDELRVASSFIVPHEQNPVFTGRDSFLEMLRTNLQENVPQRYNHRVAIHGLGGIGKTQIALEYCHRYRTHYDHIFWVAAAERTTLISGFAQIARETRVVPIKGRLEEIARRMLKWLNQNDNWLLVLDNVDDVNVVQGLLPEIISGGHTLITSRVGDVALIPAEGLEVTLMEESHAIELLARVSKSTIREEQQIEEARKIINELGRLPLAIDQAAAFIRASDQSTFLSIFQSNRVQFLAERPAGNHPYPNSLSTAWSVSLSRLSPEATEFAELLSFLNPDEILVEFLEAGNSKSDGIFAELKTNKFLFFKVLRELQSLSLVKLWDHSKKISIHRLVQAVIRERLCYECRISRQEELLNIMAVAFQYSVSNTDAVTRAVYRQFLPQITAILLSFDEEIYDRFALSTLSESVAAFLYDEGQNCECDSLNQRIFQARKRILGSDDPKTLRIARGVASVGCTRSPSQRVKGVELFEDTLKRQTRVLGPLHPETLWTKHGLAVEYDRSGRGSEAGQMLQETYESRCEVLGPDDLCTLRTKFFLAASFVRRDLYEKALEILEETFEAQARTLGGTHSDTLRTLRSMARVSANLREVGKARALYRENLMLSEQSKGGNHRSTTQVRLEIEDFEEWLKTDRSSKWMPSSHPRGADLPVQS